MPAGRAIRQQLQLSIVAVLQIEDDHRVGY